MNLSHVKYIKGQVKKARDDQNQDPAQRCFKLFVDLRFLADHAAKNELSVGDVPLVADLLIQLTPLWNVITAWIKKQLFEEDGRRY